jgi:prophage regulatory protein
MGKLDAMGVAEIARRLDVSRSRAARIVREKGFPEPVAVLTDTVIWKTADVEAWISQHRPAKEGETQPFSCPRLAAGESS